VTTRGALAAALAAACAACTIVTATLDLDSQPSRDAGVAPDAPADASTTDAPAPRNDAARCTPDAHALCDDFDTLPIGDPSRWSGLQKSPGASLTAFTSDFQSSPNALAAMIPVIPPNASANAYLSRTWQGTADDVLCEMDLKVAPYPPCDAATKEECRKGVYLANIELTGGPTSSVVKTRVVIVMYTDGPRVEMTQHYADGGQRDWPILLQSSAPPFNWAHVEMALRAGTTHAFTLRWEHEELLTVSDLLAMKSEEQLFELGVVETEVSSTVASQPWTLLFDNVVCDLY
jgi:hypothetical protein